MLDKITQNSYDCGVSARLRGFKFLCIASAAVGFTLTLQIALNANFAVEEMNLSGFQQGLLEMFRESCGIFALGILAILAGLAEPLIGAAVLIFLAVGLGSYCFVHNYFWLVIASLVWSQGLHIWMPLPNSMGLALAEPGREGRRIGQIQAAGAAGSGLGLVCALVLNIAGVAIRPLYIVAGSAALIASAACLYIPRQIRSEKPKLVIRREYGLYYLLNFLEGWRKQIFLAFAGFLLVKVYGTPLSTMLIMWIVVQAVGWFSSPAVGRLIDRIGERKILVFYYSFMTVCFLGYAFIKSKYILYGVFLLDSSFLCFRDGADDVYRQAGAGQRKDNDAQHGCCDESYRGGHDASCRRNSLEISRLSMDIPDWLCGRCRQYIGCRKSTKAHWSCD